MNDELDHAWDETARTGRAVEVRAVVCDFCHSDYTNSTASGGLIFGSYAICPVCEPKERKSIKEFGEEHHIRAECPSGMSFAAFVRAEAGDNPRYVRITRL